MTNINKIINNIIKMMVITVVTILFLKIINAKPKAAFILSFLFAAGIFFWIYIEKLDIKFFTLAFLFIYPFMPALAGLNLGGGLPVLRSHRILTLLMIMFLIRKGVWYQYYKNFFRANLFAIPLILVSITMFLSSFLSPYYAKPSIFYSISIIVEFVFLSVLVYNVFTTREDVEKLVFAWCIACVFLCFLGLIEAVTQYNFYTKFGVFDPVYLDSMDHQMRGGKIRIFTAFDHSISYAAYLSISFPLFLYKFKNNKFVYFASIGLILLTILASQSRAGIISFMAVFFFYFLFINRARIIFVMLFSIPIIFFKITELVEYVNKLNPFASTSAEMASSANARSTQFLYMIKLINESPLVGYGFAPSPIGSIDNYYLLYTFYYGYLGIIALFILFFSALIIPVKNYGKKIFSDDLMFMLMLGIVAFIIINAVAALWSFHFLFYVYIGIMTRLMVNHKKKLTGLSGEL